MNKANNVILGITGKYVIHYTKNRSALGVKINLFTARGEGTRVPKPPPPPPIKTATGLFDAKNIVNSFK